MLKGKVNSVTFNATLDIDCKTAEVIGYCMGYDLSKFLADTVGSNYSKREIEAAFRELGDSCDAITEAKRISLKAMNEALNPRKKATTSA